MAKQCAIERWLRAYGVLLPLYYFAGCVAYGYMEHFGVLDTFYFLTTTATTVGYGDLSPATETGRLFTSFYAPLGTIAVMSGLVPAMEWMLDRIDTLTAWLVLGLAKVNQSLRTSWECVHACWRCSTPAGASPPTGRTLVRRGKLRRVPTTIVANHSEFTVDLHAFGRAEAFTVVTRAALAQPHMLAGVS